MKDTRKSGGMYVTVNGFVKRIDEYKRLVILTNGTKITIDDIIVLEIRDTVI